MTTRRAFLQMLGAGPVGFVLSRMPRPIVAPHATPAYPIGSRADTADGRVFRYLRARSPLSEGQVVTCHDVGTCRSTAEMAATSCGWFHVLEPPAFV